MRLSTATKKVKGLIKSKRRERTYKQFARIIRSNINQE